MAPQTIQPTGRSKTPPVSLKHLDARRLQQTTPAHTQKTKRCKPPCTQFTSRSPTLPCAACRASAAFLLASSASLTVFFSAPMLSPAGASGTTTTLRGRDGAATAAPLAPATGAAAAAPLAGVLPAALAMEDAVGANRREGTCTTPLDPKERLLAATVGCAEGEELPAPAATLVPARRPASGAAFGEGSLVGGDLEAGAVFGAGSGAGAFLVAAGAEAGMPRVTALEAAARWAAVVRASCRGRGARGIEGF